MHRPNFGTAVASVSVSALPDLPELRKKTAPNQRFPRSTTPYRQSTAMFQGIFRSSSIPVTEQLAVFSQARHEVLAGNLANIGTPDYQARDLSVDDFQSKLREALEARRSRIPGQAVSDADLPEQNHMADVAKDPATILYHDGSSDGMEFQVTEMAKNHSQHNIAMSIMGSQFRLLGAAISERA
jgi:flagellar basal-body rod protein FlgB